MGQKFVMWDHLISVLEFHQIIFLGSQSTRGFSKAWLKEVLILFFFCKVLKVAILAEKFATDYSWYMDTILTLIRIAGDYVSEEVWISVFIVH